MLEIYQQQSFQNTFLSVELQQQQTSHYLGIPEVDDLVDTLEPTLLQYQEQHLASKDWRSLGFTTTQLNFTNRLILNHLEPAEKFLITPYLKFVEEYIAIPWYRVCVAAAKYKLDSPQLSILKQIFPAASQIAESVYRQLIELLPNHYSHRGNLNEPDITHSCLRDLNMFQAYILLCFLQESLAPIEEELVPLCVLVVEAVGIQWELTQKWCELLASTLENFVSSEQKALLEPYTQGMKKFFFKERYFLGAR